MAGPIDAKQVPRFLWLAFVASIAVYGLVAFVLTKTGSLPAQPETADRLRLPLGIAACAAGGASLWLRSRHGAAHSDVPTPAHPPQLAAPPGAAVPPLGIVAWALSEAVALFGLVLAFLGQRFEDFVPFAAAGVALLILHRPEAWLGPDEPRGVIRP